MAAGIQLDGASDHGVSEALYLRDYDQNGVELYRDRPREEWPVTPEGQLNMGRLRDRPGGPRRRAVTVPSAAPQSRSRDYPGPATCVH